MILSEKMAKIQKLRFFSTLRPKFSKLEKVIKILFPTDFSKLGKVILGQFLGLCDNFCMSYSKFSTKEVGSTQLFFQINFATPFFDVFYHE